MQRILITGTGRAGTILLVQILKALGFDTGYSLDEAKAGVDPIARAGLKPALSSDELAQVIRAPNQVNVLTRLLQSGQLDLEAAIIPVRDLHDAAESRRNVFRMAEATILNGRKHPGSLWWTRKPSRQESELATEFYRCVRIVVATGAPVFLIDFPRFVHDPAHLWQACKPVFDARGITETDVADVMWTVVRPELITALGQPSRSERRHSSTILTLASTLTRMVIGGRRVG